MGNFELAWDIFCLTVFAVNAVIATLVILLTCVYQRPITKNSPLIATCNTYAAIAIFSAIIIFVYSHTLYGNLNPTANFDNTLCYVQYHCLFISISNVYYSYCVQAWIRLFRINFYRIKIFQSLQFSVLMIVAQWTIAILSQTPMIFSTNVQYMPNDHICYVSLYNIRAYVVILSLIYLFPLSSVLVVYGYILRYTRRTVFIQDGRSLANKRDTIVLRRILIVLFVSMLLLLPTTLICFICWITNYLHPMNYRIQVLCAALSMFLQTIALAYVTPQIREVIQRKKMQVIHPKTLAVPPTQDNSN